MDESKVDQEEDEAPQASKASENSAQAQYDGDMDVFFSNVHQMIDQFNILEEGQKRIKREQRWGAEAFSRHQEDVRSHQDDIEDVARYQMVVCSYMVNGQQGDPSTFPPCRQLPPPGQP